MSVSSASTTTSSAPTDTIGGSTSTSSTSSSSANPAESLNEDDFLDLMMDQLKNQDPLNPADPTQYMSELASFSSLDEEMQISQTSSEMASNQSSSAALNMLGTTVSYTDANGNSESGVVTSVSFGSSGPTLTIGGTSGIDLSSITSVSTSGSSSSSSSGSSTDSGSSSGS